MEKKCPARKSSKQVNTVVVSCLLFLLFTIGFAGHRPATVPANEHRFVVVLGVAQDAGYPQAGCMRECCRTYWSGSTERQKVASLAIVDPISKQYWLLDATPDFTAQIKEASRRSGHVAIVPPAGIFLTHAHIGHYTGLMYLGKEAMNSSKVPVYCMNRMDSFLRNNGPWSQLVRQGNIETRLLADGVPVQLADSLSVEPLGVPHRDEYSETVGYRIRNGAISILYIPDIDKWSAWRKNIMEEVKQSNFAIVDGTFYRNGELAGRDMKEVPHPFVEETMSLFEKQAYAERSKIIFTHFNHTNPLLLRNNTAKEAVMRSGFNVAEEGMLLSLTPAN